MVAFILAAFLLAFKVILAVWISLVTFTICLAIPLEVLVYFVTGKSLIRLVKAELKDSLDQ